jgi:dTDP-4-amino-4,6-dideoxygalactose transaminase
VATICNYGGVIIYRYVPFNRPFAVGKEFDYIKQAIANEHLSGNGAFTKKCHAWLEERLGTKKALLTHSCTAALEMAAILADVQPGDEVIMPSFTFVSTANAFVLRGAVPVFVDSREDTLNIDETQIEETITGKTKAIAPVHYAGIGCEMNTIMEIADQYGLMVIEDAAQGIGFTYRDQALGTIGHLGALSFHETKNVISGEGGALLINDERWIERAEIIWEKGTNRSQFFRGQVDKYTWVDMGSSYLPSELNAAYLYAQLEHADQIAEARLSIWNRYHAAFADLEAAGKVRRPVVPPESKHYAHLYYLLFRDLAHRTDVQQKLNEVGVNAVFHYIPLHDSTAGKKFGRANNGHLSRVGGLSDRLLRLPLWYGMTDDDVNFVIERVIEFA